ncbi:VWA domain-containing protein [Chloracidobacterium sp. D]|uniref:VWA domain-containing protein n=1 Tax=Chloracidobacterium sp. D TaxID=2821536 RepID=UPI001B8D72A6|nr:VWA domain-containing protein [Chloracidobacterium sp. D]QUV81767.1 VWA domain-containing protein [Chloracidobacterium sp. D]
MTGTKFWLVVGVTLLVLLQGTSLGLDGQERTPKRPPKANPSATQDEVFTIDTSLVVLDVAVFDQDNRFVGDLRKENFRVYDEQVEQQIEYFSRDEAPVSLGFVVDTSGSMRPRRTKVIEAVKFLARAAKPGDEFFLVDFKNRAELAEEFTPRPADIEDAVDNIVWGGGTALLDAIQLSAEYADKEGKNRRKAIVVFSDGDERDSYYDRKQMLKLLQEYQVQVYIVGFPDEDDDGGLFGRSTRKRSIQLIQDIAKETGGRAFFPKTLDELPEIVRTINADLRTQYSIGFVPSQGLQGGGFRRVTVRAEDGKRKLVVRTRSGYTPRKGD